jgi:hypothetical protein
MNAMEYLIMNARRTTGVYGTYHVTGDSGGH